MSGAPIAHDAHEPPPRPMRRWPHWAALVALALALAAIATGYYMGSRPMKSPTVTAVLLCLAGTVIGAAALLPAVRRHGLERRRWQLALCGAGALGLGAAATFYVGILRPRNLMQSEEFYFNASDEEMQQLCHLTMLWWPDPHDQFINLWHVGDASSIPYILWALRAMPENGPMACTWWHGLDALKHITNHSDGNTRQDWVRWYEANRHRSVMQWWADGFAAEGFDVQADGSGDSVRQLLAVMGRSYWFQEAPKPWLAHNAARMLNQLDREHVRAAVADVLRSGTAAERRGLGWYAGGRFRFWTGLPREEAEPILLALLNNSDPSVHLCASGVLCARQEEWLRNPENWQVRRYEPGAIDEDAFFNPPDTPATVGRRAWTSSDCETSGIRGGDPPSIRIVDADPDDSDAGEKKPLGFIRLIPEQIETTDMTRVVVERLHADDPGRPLTTEVAVIGEWDEDDICWLYCRASNRLYLSARQFTCALDMATGRMLWQTGYGSDSYEGFVLLGPYLIFSNLDREVCDASNGTMLAAFVVDPDLYEEHYEGRVSLVQGTLRFMDTSDRLYVITPPGPPGHAAP
ncbi:MAG TPA: hypothetical protein PLP01_12480 [Phycisphaerae bacterium]|nr:hypothetical protein [Phycisphaerae bacterium]HOI56060.1 hypothetical protein [Phycisphaerae bacterium]